MASKDKELWKQVSGYLSSRPGWSLEPLATPGAPSTWCYGAAGQTDLSVSVEGGAISVYVTADDRDVRFADVGALAARLDAHQAVVTGTPGRGNEIGGRLGHPGMVGRAGPDG